MPYTHSHPCPCPEPQPRPGPGPFAPALVPNLALALALTSHQATFSLMWLICYFGLLCVLVLYRGECARGSRHRRGRLAHSLGLGCGFGFGFGLGLF